MIIVGSKALIEHGLKLGRKPSDTDVIGTAREFELEMNHVRSIGLDPMIKEPSSTKRIVHIKGNTPYEWEIADPELNPTGHEFLLKAPRFMKDGIDHATPDSVLALKLSHRYLKNNPHFKKTMDDILALRGLKFSVPTELQGAWMKAREKQTYNYSHPKLNQSKGQFFSGDGIDYKWEHDDIHKAMATLPRPVAPHLREPNEPCNYPAYMYFQTDGADVKVSKEKWDALHPSHGGDRVQLLSVLEESYVLALERSQVPCEFKIAPRTSFLIALEKVCTSITSGWWREFAWENYHRVLGMYSDDYVDRFHDGVSSGIIRPYQGEHK